MCGSEAASHVSGHRPPPAPAPEGATAAWPLKMKAAQFFKLRRCNPGGLYSAKPTFRQTSGRDLAR